MAQRGNPFPAFARRLCLLTALALFGAGAAVSLFGARMVRWQAFEVKVAVRPALRGQTRLLLTPLGEVRADTHRTPLALTVDLKAVSFDRMRQLIGRLPPRATLEKDFEQTIRKSLYLFAAWQIALGTLGGLIGPLLIRRLRTRRASLFSASAGGLFVTLILSLTLLTFDRSAFASPHYTGSLREAPAIFALAETAFDNAQTLSAKLRAVAGNLNTLYGRISDSRIAPAVDDAQTIRLLHISDLHNNPAAVDFVRELASRFAISAVIDTGDLTDFGTPIENGLSRALGLLPVPYVFVAGNHDSQATIAALRAVPGRRTVILDNAPVTVAGLVLLGGPDPSASRPGAGSVDTPAAALEEAGKRLAAAAQAAQPDLICVHNPRQAEPLHGRVPLILCGHLHRAEIKAIAGEGASAGTIICNAGTTGGAGWRYFDREGGVPFSAAILTFSRPVEGTSAARPRLLFIDLVTLDGSLNEYSVTRRAFGEPLTAEVP